MRAKRIVAPQRWSSINRAEHPPLMMKRLVQGVCGGLRWLETQDLAEHIARRAVEDGYPCSPKTRSALGVQKPPTRLHKGKRANARHARASAGAVVPVSTSLQPFNAVAALQPKRERIVSFDVLDCTLGGGYHSGAVLENGRPYTRVVALDCDPDAIHSAKDLVEEFGSTRFRFFCHPMSEALSMFGERSFDAVMIDPGPSATQMEDPERGFLLSDESEHGFDMRYGPQAGVNTLEYLNTVPQHALSGMLASYELLTPEQSMKFARAIRKHRPFGASRQLLEVVETAGYPLPEDGWWTQESRRKSPMSWKFLTTLRCIVNKEREELREALQQALLLLRNDGRLVFFSRLAWEEKLFKEMIDGHPHALLAYTETVPIEDVQNNGHSRHTKMWVANKVAKSSFVVKNTESLTDDTVRESSVRWMTGMFAGQTHGFPAHNFTFENMSRKEQRTLEKNAQPPPFDHDDDER